MREYLSKDILTKQVAHLPPSVKEAIRSLKITEENWKFAKPAFCNDEMEDTWATLNQRSPEAVTELTKAVLQLHEDWICAQYEKEAKEKIEALFSIRDDCLTTLAALEKYIYRDTQTMEDHWKAILDIIDKHIKLEAAQTTEFYFKDSVEQQLATPKSRKNNIENAQEIFSIRALNIIARVYFGAPMNKEITDIINVLFSASYSYDNISGFTRDIPELLQVLHYQNVDSAQ